MIDNGSGTENSNTGGQFADGIRGKAKARARQAFNQAQDAYERAGGRAREVARRADRLISDQTYPALGAVAVLALGFGLVIGLALAGRD